MPFDSNKKYLVDSQAMTARELINYAKELEPEWAIGAWRLTTSGAAKIIRDHGHIVSKEARDEQV